MHFCYSMCTDAHYPDNTFDGVNENQTSPLAVASLIIFSVRTLDLLWVSVTFLVLASFGEKL